MSHTVFHTKGIVLGHYPRGEADKMLVLYTRDFGMVHAYARSIRKTESKLRYALQDYSLAHIDLVEGRDIWRLTSAEPIQSFSPAGEIQQKILLNTVRLVRKLCAGESSNTELFDTLTDGFTFLLQISDTQLLKNIECVLVFRILYHSGYMDGTGDIQERLIMSPMSSEFLATVTPFRKKFLFSINKSMREIDA